MALSEEKLKVLKMIQEGKLTPEEGAQLLEALDEGTAPETAKSAQQSPAQGKGSGKWFHVRVTDTDNGKTRVNVRIPLGMVNAGIKMGMRFTPEIEGLDLDQLSDFIRSGEIGQVVDVYDEEDGERVEVFIE